ncbi:hypothetical protein LB559_04495 [Mesorhizobium sp. BR1-1-3]|nr:hypothetical protein [Mesorhizobium sp. BR1-1-3]
MRFLHTVSRNYLILLICTIDQGAVRQLFEDPGGCEVPAQRRLDHRLGIEGVHRPPGARPCRLHRLRCARASAPTKHRMPFEEILKVISRPFDEQQEMERYADPPRVDERVLRTFCGTFDIDVAVHL